MSEVMTIEIPHIPKLSYDDIQMPLSVSESKKYAQKILAENPDFYISDIYGSHLCLIDNEWFEIGYKVVLTKKNY